MGFQYFASLATDPNANPDGDRVNNLQEYLADTYPTDPNSYLRINRIQPVPGGMRIDWQGGIWTTQFLQQRVGWGATNIWADIFTNLVPSPNPSSFTNSIGTNRSEFYRIRVTR